MRAYDILHTDGTWRIVRHKDNWPQLWPYTEYLLQHECDGSNPYAIRYVNKRWLGPKVDENDHQNLVEEPCRHCESVCPPGLQGMILMLETL